jgi:hypothetical protein
MSDPNMDIERHGIERLRWLQEKWIWPDGIDRLAQRSTLLGASETSIEVATALIEELHDAIAFWSAPQIVIK